MVWKCLILIFFKSSQSMHHLSLNGIDLLNDLLLNIHQHNKELLSSTNEDFVKLVHSYSNFVLGACSSLRKDDFELCYKKFNLILKQVWFAVLHLQYRSSKTLFLRFLTFFDVGKKISTSIINSFESFLTSKIIFCIEYNVLVSNFFLNLT